MKAPNFLKVLWELLGVLQPRPEGLDFFRKPV